MQQRRPGPATEAQEQMLAVRLSSGQPPAVERCGARGEPALGAARPHGVTAEALPEAPCVDVDDMAFGHRRRLAESAGSFP